MSSHGLSDTSESPLDKIRKPAIARCGLGRDPGKLQTALEAAQGVLLDVEAGAAPEEAVDMSRYGSEVQWGQGELTKISPEAVAWLAKEVYSFFPLK